MTAGLLLVVHDVLLVVIASVKNKSEKKRAIIFAGIKKSVTFATHLGIVLWCNGSTSDSGSACEGSNPSRTTT